MKVFALNKQGLPLKPCSPAKARLRLKAMKANGKRRTPLTIQPTIATGKAKQPVTLGKLALYRHIGLWAAAQKAELHASEADLRQDITDRSSMRLCLRRSLRSRFTLFDKVSCKDELSFIFGRWASESIHACWLESTRLPAGISCKKLRPFSIANNLFD